MVQVQGCDGLCSTRFRSRHHCEDVYGLDEDANHRTGVKLNAEAPKLGRSGELAMILCIPWSCQSPCHNRDYLVCKLLTRKRHMALIVS